MSPSWSSRPGIPAIDSGSSPWKFIRPLPRQLRERLLEVAGELVDLPAQVHVLHERLGEGLELGALLRASSSS